MSEIFVNVKLSLGRQIRKGSRGGSLVKYVLEFVRRRCYSTVCSSALLIVGALGVIAFHFHTVFIFYVIERSGLVDLASVVVSVVVRAHGCFSFI